MAGLTVGDRFAGPLFVVGLPRSGTKLLRDLLNRHPDVALPTVESDFLPHYFGDRDAGENPSEEAVGRFHDYLRGTVFYRNFRRIGVELEREELERRARGLTWRELVEAVWRFYGGEGRIWGDKTPSYLLHMPFLERMFPGARFLHILRDPRDCALSTRRTWGRSLLRAAERWRRGVERARRQPPERYLEVHYERLVTEPEATLRRACAFVEIDLTPAMLTLDAPAEGYGDARGRTEIVADNVAKYREHLSARTIRRIEEITGPALADMPLYEPEHATRQRPATPLEMAMGRARDAVASTLFHLREKGWSRGIAYIVSSYRRSAWRGEETV